MTETTDDTTGTGEQTDESRRRAVRERYGDLATSGESCCSGTEDGDRSEESDADSSADTQSLDLGYESDDLESAPEGANLGLGCGNPVAISNLEAGETVLDLGSGGGFDCFLAAQEVGPEGRVIGVDMTPEMLERARENAADSEFDTVEFRLGEIEHLPVADASIDVIISNCVVNLSPSKEQVLEEAFRVLVPGGRVSISDLVATDPLPAGARENPELVTDCIGGVATIEELEGWLEAVGFESIRIVDEGAWDAEYEGEALPIVSARIEARKPEQE